MLRHDLVEHIKDGSRGHITKLYQHRDRQWARVRWLAAKDYPEVDGDLPVTLLRVVEVRADARVAG